MDEFKGLRGTEEEEAGRKDAPDEAGDGFQVVHDKNKRPSGQGFGNNGSDAILGSGSARMTTKDKAAAAPWTKAKVLFHDPSIPRPQDVYSIRVNNYNIPFDHVWLERSEDGTRPIHPLVSVSFLPLVTICSFSIACCVYNGGTMNSLIKV